MSQKCLQGTFSYVMLICQIYLHTSLQIFPSKTEMICFQIDQREYQLLNSSMLGSHNETDSAASSREELDFTCVDLEY